jgi:hypothetical protein
MKIAPRASVSPEFIDTVRFVAAVRLERLSLESGQMAIKSYKEKFMKDNGVRISRMKDLIKNPAAIDMLVAKLRSQPYTQFLTETYGDKTYLCGITKDIAIAEDRLDLGPYEMCVNTTSIIETKSTDWHFIPMRAPYDGQRFFHHYALGNENDQRKLTHPLNCESHTCWGQFGSFPTMALGEMDFAEMFRVLHVYISRHNAASELKPHWVGYGYKITLPFARAL